MNTTRRIAGAAILAIAVVATGVGSAGSAQGQAVRGQQSLQSPRAAAPFDLTGYWVSVITEEWRVRMVTPLKGDYSGVPLTPEGRKVADTWDQSKDGSCLAYGAAGLLRMPLRVRITWESDSVLRIETDAGMQTRRLFFDKSQQPGPRSLQGFSVAEWESSSGTGPDGGLKVTTTNMTGGWVRRNGVPYSQDAMLTEYWDRFAGPGRDEWFSVTTIVDDPKSFTQPFTTSSHFKKEPDGSRWRASPCRNIT
ncbi:MAG: hypothetical protein HYX77_05065 [Acidobacteria bacterium]|nr:hypothetical protein [Acidobacteriota bacterium]